ncbi:MAG: thiopurine S-methyltransferase [Oceanospirillaceae bacterium]|nr:thiopurine S-methyltransferase [Oceanospirillaceae bacterium]MCP5351160.1 thiopurine S-methyltransferase [Oceanospirillaceae bacterium]
MDAEFWHQRWQKGETAFHEGQVNRLLEQHFQALNLPVGSRVFLPLCGKTRDIAWLLDKGYQVVGAELSELAVKELFAGLGLTPVVIEKENYRHYQAAQIDILVGDIFQLRQADIGRVDAIYDRAALVALPEIMRADYARQLIELGQTAPQLIITYEYAQHEMPGPPFAIPAAEVQQHYALLYGIHEQVRQVLQGGLKGKTSATEVLWLLTPL